MRVGTLAWVVGLLFYLPAVFGEEAGALRERGIQALKESQTDQSAIVQAARCFAKAAELYSAAGDDEHSVEMNSFLYWCRKKMTLQDIEQFAKSGEALVAEKLTAAEKEAAKADEAPKWLARAEKFAQANPAEHLLIAIRFFEVADRFKGTDASLAAQDRSLNEQVLSQGRANSKTPAVPVEPKRERLPIPDAKAQQDAEKNIKDIFKAEYAKSSAGDKSALSRTLLTQAQDPKEEPAARYVLFREAAALGVQAGDAEAAMKPIAEMSALFAADGVALQREAFVKLSAMAASAEAKIALARAGIEVIGAAISAGDFSAAVEIAGMAESMARKAPDAKLAAFAASKGREAAELQTEQKAFKAGQKVLADKPDDPHANLAVGKFLCFVQGDWSGLAMLSKSSDAALKAIAVKDLLGTVETKEQAALGDDWFALAQAEQNKRIKTALATRAAHWYEKAMAQSTGGLLKVRLEKQLEETAKMTKAPDSPGGLKVKIDVLALIDVQKDAVKGKWVRKEGGIECDAGTNHRIEIPYQPPQEYDFKVVFTMKEGYQVAQNLSADGKGFEWVMGAQKGQFNILSGFKGTDETTRIKTGGQLHLSQPHTSVVEIRKDRVRVTLDGKLVIDLKTDFNDMTQPTAWKLRDTKLIGFGGYNTVVLFQQAEVTEISGEGEHGARGAVKGIDFSDDLLLKKYHFEA